MAKANTNITHWECSGYKGTPRSGDNAASIPDNLRCWTNQYYQGGKCSVNYTTSRNRPRYEKSYKCTGHYSQDGTRWTLGLSSVTPNSSIAHHVHINDLKASVYNEILARQKNKQYQSGYISRTKSKDGIDSAQIYNINIADVTSADIAYKSIIEVLETYIKAADKEQELNQFGSGPSVSAVDFSEPQIMYADQQNTLCSIIYTTVHDCICYSDCAEYSVCYCYSNCRYY